MNNGVIKSFLADKGFGFIKRDEGGADMFFHSSAVSGDELGKLVRGARVAYEVGMKRGKEQAKSVTIVSIPKKAEPVNQLLAGVMKRRPPPEQLSELEAFEKEWGLRPVQ